MAPNNEDFFTEAKNLDVDTVKNLKILKESSISKVWEKNSAFNNPVSITFQNGFVKKKNVDKLKAALKLKPNYGTDVEVQNSCGHNFVNSNCNLPPKQKQIIALRNKKTNKMRLVEIDNVTLINTVLVNTVDKSITDTDYSKDIKTLNKSFGGKKIVTQIEQREKINVNPDLIAYEVNEAVAGVNVEISEDVSNKESESISDLLPPCHRDVKIVSEVYKMNEILSEEEMDALKNEISYKEDFKPLEYSRFFLYCVEEVKKSENDVNNKLAGILFTETLIKFLKMPVKKISSKNAVLCSFSNVLHLKLLNEFCVKNKSSITRPMTMRDKCLCYIIATCLICCNYQINLKLLATDVSVHLSRLGRLARIVGATPLTKDEHTFVLKLPLASIPKVSKMKGRGK